MAMISSKKIIRLSDGEKSEQGNIFAKQYACVIKPSAENLSCQSVQFRRRQSEWPQWQQQSHCL